MGYAPDVLGLKAPISRRDFLNGVLLTSAGLLLHGKAPRISPADAFNGYGGIGDYAHSNANTWEVLSAGHAMRDGAFETRIAHATDTGEIYDLVAVGGGISGLAAAVFFQKYRGGRALVIDNQPIFGGEAKRNQFMVDGQRLTAHQGSAIFLVPKKGGYTDQFYEMIGMDRSSFDNQTWRGPLPRCSSLTRRTECRRTTGATSHCSSASGNHAFLNYIEERRLHLRPRNRFSRCQSRSWK